MGETIHMFDLFGAPAIEISKRFGRRFGRMSQALAGVAQRLSKPACWLCLAALVSACGKPETSAETAAEPAADFGVLIFGDSGYHLGYPDEDDYEDVFTAEEYLENEYADWIDDKRPVEEFEPGPSAVSPVTGGVVPATGMHRISAAMKRYCTEVATCDFGVMLGDNIYPDGATLGADGMNDATRFREILGEPFGSLVEDPAHYVTYVTLGNHDWKTSRAGGFAQMAYLSDHGGFHIEGPFYSVRPQGVGGAVELFVIDTSMMLASMTVRKDRLNDDGSEASTDEIDEPSYAVEPLTDAERNMHIWLEDALRTSSAQWKLVVAHHPIWSSSGGKFEEARAMRKAILPAMCRYADAFLAGHEHTLEIHTDNCAAALGRPAEKPLVQIVSGAAAKQRPIHTSFMRHQASRYPEHTTVWAEGLLWGFAHLRVSGDRATVTLLSIPDAESEDMSVEFEYGFERRSHRVYGDS